jgi:hypothetical protein
VDESIWFLSDVQFRAFAAPVYRYLRQNPRRRRRRRKLTVADLLRMFLLSTKQNQMQCLLAERFRISQSSVVRALSYVRVLVCEVFGRDIGAPEGLKELIDELLAAGGGQGVALVDGTIVPLGSSAIDRENYSGKVRRVGKNLQVITDGNGKLLAVSVPIPGRTHDKLAFDLSGFEKHLVRDGLTAIGDRGYEGSKLKTPCKWYKHKAFTLWDWAENRALSTIRNAVERAIAHLKALSVLRTGIRTRATDRDQVVRAIIVSAVALFLFRQNWRLEHP